MALHTQHSGSTPSQSLAEAPHPVTQPVTCTKPPMDQASNSTEPSSSAPKSSKLTEKSRSTAPTSFLSSPQVTHVPPAFAPRDSYVKLMFRDNPSVDVKIQWLSDVTRTFCLDRELAEVKMSAVTYSFVYISRRRTDIIQRATEEEFLSLKLDAQDSIERPQKFHTYLITRYPVGVDSSLANELPGVYTASRFYQYGTPINSSLSHGVSLNYRHLHSASASFLAFHRASLEG